jgi:hypothetical protein
MMPTWEAEGWIETRTVEDEYAIRVMGKFKRGYQGPPGPAERRATLHAGRSRALP